MTDKIKIGISHGDINGIGYEIILKTLQDDRILDMCTPILYGSPKVAAYYKKAINLNNVNFVHIRTPQEANSKKLYIINCIDDNIRVELGKPTQEAGESSFLALDRATSDLRNGIIDALVTAPINKDTIQNKDFKFHGHTEYLANKLEADEFMMFMVSEEIKMGLVTTHLPIAEVAENITKEKILSKLKIISNTLESDFAIAKPRIAVFGLNPHAGDNGLIGKEEKEIIIPALEQARDEGIIALGPYPADGFFGSSDYKKFDAILAMYHDQGLIPFKLLSFESGINFTAGLPYVRTSPAHGTAYSLAGKGEALEDSFRQALYSAIDIYRNRARYNELTENPLPSYDVNANIRENRKIKRDHNPQ